MAKLSMIQRELKRTKLVAKYAARRHAIKEQLSSTELSFEEREALQITLQKLPRDSSPVRQRNRCGVTGRPNGYFRKFGLSRNKLREAMMRGDVPGLRKASW
ncbi:30S ribosomal protein S14 [Ectothiorhodospiraceae bacterium BW-2]|nr:30S ribosomal protein S14 [Ectothiorhodospiraceae bacterium BW-2]